MLTLAHPRTPREPELTEAIEERADILEFEAGLPRDVAEDVARGNVLAPVPNPDLSAVPDSELLAILARPYPRLISKGATGEIDRINRFLENNPTVGNDEFIRWLLVMPYVEPTAHEGARVDYPEGWQTDPEWWARVVDWDVR
jgi:hypothetical protein